MLMGFTSCTNRSNNNSVKEEIISNDLDVVYDIPSLKGKNIDQVIEILGIPEIDNSEPTDLQKKVGIDEWNKTYKREGYELVITYKVNSRKIIDLFVPTNDPSGKTQNYKELMQITNTINTEGISVELVPTIVDPSSYTGIIIKFN